MFGKIHVVRSIFLDVLYVILMDVFWTEALFNGLRRKDVAVPARNHSVGIDPLIPCNVYRQRVIAQRFHLISCQVSVRVVSQYGIFSYKNT